MSRTNGALGVPHYIDGDQAAAEGAIAAGCNFVAGYPITPSTEIVERLAWRFAATGGTFIQMEDEIASSIAIQGAVWGGAKAMTVSSGPGISLMMEHIGLAAMTEVPCVIVNVQRGGPSTGLPTLPAQADMMQARWGSHGDYEIIALSPNSPQECFDLIIHAFNLSEQYRVPVMFMMDESVGHLTEKVVIPPSDQIETVPRRYTKLPPGEYKPYQVGGDLVPEFAPVGRGYRFHITGLTHDERGYPAATPEYQDKLVHRLVDKITTNVDRISLRDEDEMDDADVVVVTYGISSRTAMPGIRQARKEGVNVGHLRLIVVWPFPEAYIRSLAGRIKAFVVPELNLGQVVREVERCAGGQCSVCSVPHAGGTIHDPQTIKTAIMEAAR